jgi:hypothetical protein
MEVTRALWKRVCLVAIAVVMAGTSLAFFVPTKSALAAVSYYLPYAYGTTAILTQGPGGGVSHQHGTDYAYAYDFDLSGGEVWASAPGTVRDKVTTVTGQTSTPNWGNYVVVEHVDGTCTRYAHMAHGTITTLAEGATVGQGEYLGIEGNTGSTLPAGGGHHLHFQRETCGTDNSRSVSFVESNYTSLNPQGQADQYDAGPSLVLSSSNTLMVQHTARNGDAKTNIKYYGGSGYQAVATGTSSEWATSGTSDIAIDPTASNTAWVAAIKDEGEHGKLFLFKVTPNGSTNMGSLSVNDDQVDHWSLGAPPSIVVDSQGNVYVAAVQYDGDMSIFKRNGATGNVGRVSIGNAGAWSTQGTVALALDPEDDSVWYIAVTKEPIDEVRVYKGTPHTLTFDYYGKLGESDAWTTKAAPSLVVDDDGDVTAVAVKNDGTMWGFHNVDGAENNWPKINDDVGSVDTWSTGGSATLAVSKAVSSNDRVYVAGVRNADSQGGEMPIFMMQPSTVVQDSVWSFDEMLGNSTTWSEYAAPDLLVAPGGTVFLAAVSRAGYLHSYSRNASTGDWSSYGLIGSNGWAGNLP